MFKREEKSKETINQANTQMDPNARNLIAAGTNITGDINTDGVIRFDGKLKGNLITTGKLVIGPTGAITGEIKCKNADIEGIVEGKIYVTDLLALKATSKFRGEIVTKKLAVEAGAIFNGTCTMNSTPEEVVLKDDKKQPK
jgi:cytoskeletal protein CcmA (bactofilin family)